MKMFVKALHDAKAGLLLGSNSGVPWGLPNIHGFATHVELHNFVDARLTPYQALQTATRNAAEFLGALDEFGTVEIGKRADLILVNGNPLDKVGNAGPISGVMVRGRWFPEKELQRMLKELADGHQKKAR